MNTNKQIAEKYYKYFSGKDGNQHIAGLYALEKIIEILKREKPKDILEVGLGIGSISYSIIDFLKSMKRSFKYVGTEANAFCLGELPKNLGNHYDDLVLKDSIESIDKGDTFDFIIVDGIDQSLSKVRDLTKRNSVIFIEGDRKDQQAKIQTLFPKNKTVHTISNYKEPEYGPFDSNHWSGGGKLIFTNPNLRQTLFWLTEKMRSYQRHKYRKAHS